MIKDNYIDIHSHIIPNVDDGSKSMEESIEMLRQARDEGIRAMILTPHFGIENGFSPTKEAVAQGFEALKEIAALQFPDMELYLGCELFATGRIYDRAMGRTMAGTDYLMLEFTEYDAEQTTYADICNTMLGIAQKGIYKPILAHANRYNGFDGHLAEFKHLVECGVYIQVNAFDLAENPKESIRSRAQWLAENRLIHFLGTDAHRVIRQKPNQQLRQPKMRSGVEYLYEYCDEKYVDALVRCNAEKLLKNEAVSHVWTA